MARVSSAIPRLKSIEKSFRACVQGYAAALKGIDAALSRRLSTADETLLHALRPRCLDQYNEAQRIAGDLITGVESQGEGREIRVGQQRGPLRPTGSEATNATHDKAD